MRWKDKPECRYSVGVGTVHPISSGSLLVRTGGQHTWKLGSIPRQMTRGINSVGRVAPLQGECQRFKSAILHV